MFYLFEIIDNSRAHPVYPELVALVGSRVPDYRGIFLRGQGSQTSTHYGVVTHSSAGLEVLPGDAIRNFTGDIDQAGFVGFKARSAGVLYEDAYDDGQDTSLGHLQKGKGLGSGISLMLPAQHLLLRKSAQ